MGWVLGAAALVVLTVGIVTCARSRHSNEGKTAALLSFIVGADLLVFAVDAALV